MEPLAILKADPLDILFDNRNKNYGAYPLRKYYDRRLLLALTVSISTGIIFFVLLTIGPEPVMVKPVSIFQELIFLPPPPTVKPSVTPLTPHHSVRGASVKSTTLQIVPDKAVSRPLPTIAELSGAHVGMNDVAGPPDAGNGSGAPASGSGAEVSLPVKQIEPEVYKNADVMPQFPGGLEALQRFLTRNLRMPDNAEAGTKVSVLATFIVGADGRVTQSAVTRSGGAKFDAEVKRVLAKMPVWIPGRVGSRTVPVYFTLPVQFLIPEE